MSREMSPEVVVLERRAEEWASDKDPWRKIIGKRVLEYIEQCADDADVDPARFSDAVIGEFDTWVREGLHTQLDSTLDEIWGEEDDE